MKFKERVNLEYKELEKKFDARDRLYELLERHFQKYGNIPADHVPAWNKYQEDKRKWRDIPGMKKRLMKIAKINARNQQLTPAQKQKKSAEYLDKQLKRMGR